MCSVSEDSQFSRELRKRILENMKGHLFLIFSIATVIQYALSADFPLSSTKILRPRSEMFPRSKQSRASTHIIPAKAAEPVDMREFCGKSQVDTGRIVGGKEAVPHEFPWQVAITVDGKSFCGGSLISAEWVLTAAHCTVGASQFSVLLGAHNITRDEPSQLVIETTQSASHPTWDSVTNKNDIALLRLPESVTFTREISPVCLAPSNESNHDKDILLLSGWGNTNDPNSDVLSDVLMKVTAPGMSTAECADQYGDMIADDILCVDTTGKHGPCNGDSGSPLSFDNSGVYVQVGIVSFGHTVGCTRGYPAGFTRVSSYAQWITMVTGLIF